MIQSFRFWLERSQRSSEVAAANRIDNKVLSIAHPNHVGRIRANPAASRGESNPDRREHLNTREAFGSTTYVCKVDCMPSAATTMSTSKLSPCANCNRAEDVVWTIPTQRWPRRIVSRRKICGERIQQISPMHAVHAVPASRVGRDDRTDNCPVGPVVLGARHQFSRRPRLRLRRAPVVRVAADRSEEGAVRRRSRRALWPARKP